MPQSLSLDRPGFWKREVGGMTHKKRVFVLGSYHVCKWHELDTTPWYKARYEDFFLLFQQGLGGGLFFGDTAGLRCSILWGEFTRWNKLRGFYPIWTEGSARLAKKRLLRKLSHRLLMIRYPKDWKYLFQDPGSSGINPQRCLGHLWKSGSENLLVLLIIRPNAFVVIVISESVKPVSQP